MVRNLGSAFKRAINKNLRSSHMFFTILLRHPASLVGFIILVIFACMATIGPLLVSSDLTIHVDQRYLVPSLKHPLGTDYGGRDTLQLIILGSRDVILIAVLTVLITTSVGVIVGVTSGSLGGRVDSALVTIVDITLTIPGLPLLLVIVGLTRDLIARAPFLMALVLSITAWAGLARSIRSQVLAVKEMEFIEAAKTLGLSPLHILLYEIIPNLMPYIVMNMIITMIGAIYSQVGLYFLGILPFTPTNWGVMLNLASNSILGLIFSPGGIYYLLAPMICIALLQVGLILLTNVTDEIFNPRLREE